MSHELFIGFAPSAKDVVQGV